MHWKNLHYSTFLLITKNLTNYNQQKWWMRQRHFFNNLIVFCGFYHVKCNEKTASHYFLYLYNKCRILFPKSGGCTNFSTNGTYNYVFIYLQYKNCIFYSCINNKNCRIIICNNGGRAKQILQKLFPQIFQLKNSLYLSDTVFGKLHNDKCNRKNSISQFFNNTKNIEFYL
jgi:hypothetical protein